MKIDADQILSGISDDTLHDIVTRCANNAGVSLTSGQCATLVEAAKTGVRQACDEVSREQAVQTMIRRETLRFFRQVGRPNGRQFL